MRWEGQHIAEPPSDPDNDEDRLDVSEWVADTSVSPEGWALLKDALKGMPAPARSAFILHRAYGLPIESNDPAELTVSRYFGKTSRTIRNWLRSAEEHLRVWRGEEK
jgi:DNA-directed RNA polymerase specialized sigma24 family protein